MGISLFDDNCEYDEWIEFILIDIYKKYGTCKPDFLIEGTVKNCEDIDIWLGEKLRESRWIKYKRIEGNMFELKAFFPDPPDEACYKIVKTCLSLSEKYGKEAFFKMGAFIYNEAEAKRESFLCLKEGFSEIYCLANKAKDPEGKGRLIFEVSFGQFSELYHCYESGYLILEMKD